MENHTQTYWFLVISLSNTSPEFFGDQNRFLLDLSNTFSQYLMFCANSGKQDVKNLESSVVIQELELAIKLAL